MNKFNLLDWDTEFFGFPVYKMKIPLKETDLDLVNTIIDIKHKNYGLLVIEIDSRMNHYLLDIQNQKFKYITSRFSLSYKAKPQIQAPPKYDIKNNANIKKINLSVKLKNDLAELFGDSFTKSRFAIDDRFGHEISKKIYTKLALNYFEDHNYDTYIIQINESIKGFITIEKRSGFIAMIAVYPKERKKGYAKQLLQHMIISKKYKSITVGTTIENVSAIKLYNDSGFDTEKIDHIFHSE